jgi:hypothetical protein
MNRAERAKRFTEALAFSDRWDREASADEATSIALISVALDPLGYEARRRVLRWALQKFGIERETL